MGPRRGHVRIADRLDLLEPALISNGIELGEDFIEQADQSFGVPGVRKESQRSGRPDSTLVTQVPQTPCSHDMDTLNPCSLSTMAILLSPGTVTTVPVLAISTSKAQSLSLCTATRP